MSPDARSRGLLPGFANSADLGGLALPDGRQVPFGRVIRANTPERLTGGELTAARAAGFAAVLDLRSQDELDDCPHPLGGIPGYRWTPLIDPAAEARTDISRYRTLGEIYASSLQRNATHIAAILGALAEVPPGPSAVLISCRAGRDRTGMVVALLLDLVGVSREVIAADYAVLPESSTAALDPTRPPGADILHMLDHVDTAYGSVAGYLHALGLDNGAVEALRRRLSP